MATRFPTRQRGAIGLMAALTLALALVFALLVIDSGRLYLEQRSLQRVVDMAALEAAGQSAVCTGSGPQAATVAQASAAHNGFAPGAKHTLATTCGTLQTGAGSRRTYTVNPSKSEAIRVSASSAVATSIAAGVQALLSGVAVPATTTLHASAVASLPKPPQAMLRLKSTLLTIDTRKSDVLNALFKALGGNVNLDVLGWQGIADVNVDLLSFLDALAIKAGVQVGNYDELLGKQLHLTDLLDVAVDLARRGGAAAQVVTDLGKLVLGAGNNPLIKLGDILDIQNGAVQSGLDAQVQLLQLLKASVMLANKNTAATAEVPLNIPPLVKANLRLKVIEPEQISAVGNPQYDTIKVHTAQVRALVSLELPLLNSITGLLNAVLDLAEPLTNVVSNLLSLNLVATLESVFCLLAIPCKVSDVRLLPGVVHLDIGLEVASASSQVTRYSCKPDKTLTASTRSSALNVSVGMFSDPQAFFSTGNTAISPLPLIDIGSKYCTRFLILPSTCGARTAFAGGGVGLKVNAPLLGSNSTGPATDLLFRNASAPPDIDLPPAYMATSASDIVQSLNNTINGIELQVYRPLNGNLLGNVLVVAGNLLDDVKALLQPVIRNLLGKLVDPLVNTLLKALGLDLVNVEVGANLTCDGNRAQLML